MNDRTRLDLSHGFDAGNYANAYTTRGFGAELRTLESDGRSDAYIAAYILGWYSSYALTEIDEREEYDEAYWSNYGQAVVAAGYIDSREDEYAAEEEAS